MHRKVRAMRVVSSALGLALCACVSSSAQSVVIAKGAFELRCSQEQMEVKELAPNSFGVRGCGKQTQYNCIQSGYDYLCVRDGEVQPQR